MIVVISAFPPNAAVTISLVSPTSAFPERSLASTSTDVLGMAMVDAVIPSDTPFGDATLRVAASEGCSVDIDILVAPSLALISIDDDTVIPGQRVTLTAGGFAAEEQVTLYLDGDPRDALCRCRDIASARTSTDGSVVIITRIPRDISLGEHFLLLNGWSFDDMHDLGLVVRVTVISAGTLPPTDM